MSDDGDPAEPDTSFYGGPQVWPALIEDTAARAEVDIETVEKVMNARGPRPLTYEVAAEVAAETGVKVETVETVYVAWKRQRWETPRP